MTLTLVFPMPPNLANGRMHWRVKWKAKVAYWAQLDLLQRAKRLPPPPKVPHARARVSSVMVLGNPMDEGNAMNRHKWIEDWLVTRGYLEDDRRTCLTWDGFPAQIVTRKEPASITLTLTPDDT